jgi:hypothetical protein
MPPATYRPSCGLALSVPAAFQLSSCFTDSSRHFPRGLYDGLQYRWAFLPMLGNRPTKALLKSLNLNVGGTQAGDLDDRAIA